MLSLGSGAALLALRLDAVSVSMALLVSFVGWIVVRYARSYLDGEAREGRFHGLMLATLAAVLVLVQAGSLRCSSRASSPSASCCASCCCSTPSGAEAQRAAAKFSLVWGAGDVALIIAAVLIGTSFGTGEPRRHRRRCREWSAARRHSWASRSWCWRRR